MSPAPQPTAVQYYCHVPPSVSRDQYTALSLEGVLVTWYRRIFYIYTSWYNFDTVLYQFLKTETSDRWLFGIVQLLRFSGFSLYPLFSFTVPLTPEWVLYATKNPSWKSSMACRDNNRPTIGYPMRVYEQSVLVWWTILT